MTYNAVQSQIFHTSMKIEENRESLQSRLILIKNRNPLIIQKQTKNYSNKLAINDQGLLSVG